ncbi:MAG TPA: GAF domain-containing protein [Chloroflexia bacterium]|nr:GAF domain-containing protein [Chloroflexia bacterium]
MQEVAVRQDNLAGSASKEAARLRTVLEVGRKVTSILDLDRLLTESVRLIQQTFGYELVTIFLRDQHDQDFYFNSHYYGTLRADMEGGDGRRSVLYRRNHISKGMVGWVFRHEQHRLANDVTQDPYYLACDDTRAELDLPLKMNGQVIGVLDLESSQVNAFDPEDVPFLEILADQIAIAIENARLAARAREAAIAEERNRLARNLHDDTVQALIGITRQLDLLRCDLSDEFSDSNLEGSGEEVALPAKLERRLDRLQDSLDRTIQGLRLLSRELQPQLLRDLGLPAALDALASDISRTSNLKVKVEIRDGAKCLTTQQELEVYRIAQEALANIVKHASATSVTLALSVEDDTVLLDITDDGKGFEVPDDLTNLARKGGMGVLSMRQRACNVGGFLTIQSKLGQGTTLSLELPASMSQIGEEIESV